MHKILGVPIEASRVRRNHGLILELMYKRKDEINENKRYKLSASADIVRKFIRV